MQNYLATCIWCLSHVLSMHWTIIVGFIGRHYTCTAQCPSFSIVVVVCCCLRMFFPLILFLLLFFQALLNHLIVFIYLFIYDCSLIFFFRRKVDNFLFICIKFDFQWKSRINLHDSCHFECWCSVCQHYFDWHNLMLTFLLTLLPQICLTC